MGGEGLWAAWVAPSAVEVCAGWVSARTDCVSMWRLSAGRPVESPSLAKCVVGVGEILEGEPSPLEVAETVRGVTERLSKRSRAVTYAPSRSCLRAIGKNG